MKKAIILLFVILSVAIFAYGYGYESGYEKGLYTPRPIQKPASGTILTGGEYYGSEITVHADSSYDYVVLLKDSNEVVLLAFYVQAGDSVTVSVPDERLYVYFASGKYWYGYGKGLMFGEDTDYSKDDHIKNFAKYTYEYTLYPVTDGNFSETPSNEDEFF